MNPLQNLSIRNKLVAVIAFSTMLFLAIGFAVDVFLDLRAFRRELIEQTVTLARVTAEHSVAELAFLDSEAADETLGKLRSVPSIEGAYLHDLDGRLFARYRRAETAPEDVRPGPRESGLESHHLRVTEPVIWEGEHYGTLTVLASTIALREKIYGYLMTMGVLLLLLLAGSIVVALRLEKLISQPILQLATAARSVSEEHDYSIRVPRGTSDEIGQLADSFNDMLSQIEKRQRERDEANQRTREKSQFLANMSHELRTPLNAIIGFSEILRGRLEKRLSDKEVTFLENINVSGHHLLSLVNDILDLSKIEAGKLEINPEPTNVDASIRSISNLMRGISSKRGVELIVDVPHDVPEIEADPGKLKQILYNLLSNAVKFSSDRGRVWMSARLVETARSPLGEPSVAMSVRDEGVGIAPADHELIFREFQQIDSSLGRKFGGTGLGLALVRKFTEAHGGVIEVESSLGEGSTFTVFLPVVFRGAITDVDHMPEVLTQEVLRDYVVIIEENAPAYLSWKRQLIEAGFHPVWARSGQEGVAVARRLQAVAVVIDPLIHEVDPWHVIAALIGARGDSGMSVVVASFDPRTHQARVIEADAWAVARPSSVRTALEFIMIEEGPFRIAGVYGNDPLFLDAARQALEAVRIVPAVTDDADVAFAGLDDAPLLVLQLDVDDWAGLGLIDRIRSSGASDVRVIAVVPEDASARDLPRAAAVVERITPIADLVEVVSRKVQRCRNLGNRQESR